MTLNKLYGLSKESLKVMLDALDEAMRQDDWRDDEIVNGMPSIDWAEHVTIAYQKANSSPASTP